MKNNPLFKPFGSLIGRNDDEEDGGGGYSAVVTTDDDSHQDHTMSSSFPPCFMDEADEVYNVAESSDENDNGTLRPGDHVYVWKSFGVPRAYQRHGIVLSVDSNKVDPLDAVTVVSFYHQSDGGEHEPLNNKDNEQEENDNNEDNDDDASHDSFDNEVIDDYDKEQRGAAVRTESLRTFCDNRAKVHKVQYGSGVAKRLLSRAGTVTACQSDDQGLVLARVHYLLDRPTQLPPHHVLSANGECAAVWCKLGRWCTLQGSSILEILFVGQAGGAAAGGVIASNVFFWTPMPGFWGAVGFWWYVPATVAYPVIVPLLVTFGLMSLVPLEILRRYRSKWKTITFGLNHDFWLHASQEIQEDFFATSTSADEDWMKKFFGADKHEEEDGGRYMPLDTHGEDDDHDDDEAMMERHREHVAAAYHMDHTGRPPQQENSFLKQIASMRQRWNQSWTNYCNKIKAKFPTSAKEDWAVPLNANKDDSRQQRERRLSWRKSWTNNDDQGERQNLFQKWTNSFTRKSSQEEKTRTTPALELLDDDDEEDLLI